MINKATVKENKKLTYDVFELTLQTPEPIIFEGGQFITTKITDQEKPCFRAYSIASPPSDREVKLCIKKMEGGRGSTWLNALKIDDEIEFLGPSGKFTFNTSPTPALFIATGTGIAPFISMIQDQLKKGSKQNLHLLFGLRHIKDIFYKDLLDALQEKHENFTYELTLSQPEDESWQGSKGRVTAVLESAQFAPDTQVYICGLNAMIESVQTILKQKGIPEENVHFEKYD